jgi:hypothetical protein
MNFYCLRVVEETQEIMIEDHSIRDGVLMTSPQSLTVEIIGATLSTHFKNYDFAVLGSPRSSTLTSPPSLVPPGSLFGDPPNSKHGTAFRATECN